MRIAYVVSEYPAPSHTFIRREIAALRRLGFDIATFSIRPSHGAQTTAAGLEEQRRTVAVQALPKARAIAGALSEAGRSPWRALETLRLALSHRPPGLRAWLWSLFHFAEALILAGLLRRAGATHVHSHFANSGATVAMLTAHVLRLPWSFTIHGISETDYPAGLLLGDKIRHARFVACASWFMQAQAMRVVAAEQWTKLSIVRCGVVFEELPRLASRTDDGTVTLVCVARLSREKGHAGLLAATKRLVEAGHAVRLNLVGDGPEAADLRSLAERLGLGDHVAFAGQLDERSTLEAIAAADILVLPSLMEGLPVVLMEAMALAKPVVASHVAGIPELVSPDNGVLFRPADWEHLGASIEDLVADPLLRRRLGQAGRAAVEAEFTAAKAAERMSALFRQAPDRSQASSQQGRA